jgi:hypothetical protein
LLLLLLLLLRGQQLRLLLRRRRLLLLLLRLRGFVQVHGLCPAARVGLPLPPLSFMRRAPGAAPRRSRARPLPLGRGAGV